MMTESALTLEFLRNDGFSLETPFGWGLLVAQPERRWAMARQLLATKKVRRALDTPPLKDADVTATGKHSDYIQDILVHDADAPRWTGIDQRHRVPEVTVPVSSIAGPARSSYPGSCTTFKHCKRPAGPPGSPSARGRTRPSDLAPAAVGDAQGDLDAARRLALAAKGCGNKPKTPPRTTYMPPRTPATTTSTGGRSSATRWRRAGTSSSRSRRSSSSSWASSP